MPFISKQDFAELDRVRRFRDLDEDLNEKYQKKTKALEKSYQQDREDLEDDLQDQLRSGQRAIKDQLSAKDDKITELKDSQDRTVLSLKREISKLEEVIDEDADAAEVLSEKLLAQDELIKNQMAIDQAQVDLDNSRAALASDRKAFDGDKARFEARVIKREAELADLETGMYKKGYTDGTSDTLREAQADVKEAVNQTVESVTSLASKALDRESTIIVTQAAPQRSDNNQKQKN